MRMGLEKRYFTVGRNKQNASQLIVYIAVILSAIFSLLFIRNLKDVFIRYLKPYAINIGSDSINNSVSEFFADNNYSYNDFVIYTYNKDDEITSVCANTVSMNKIKADMSIYLQSSIDKTKTQSLKIPIGSISKNPVFSGFGPTLSIKIKACDLSDLDFCDKFESEGINQVRHKIFVNVKVIISVHCFGFSTKETVEDTILLSETVIVGRVPQYFGAGAILEEDNETQEE